MATGYRIRGTDPYGNREEKEIVVYNTESFKPEGNLAAVLIEKWGLVACVPDGEDSSGRSKLRLMSPSELAQRACDTSEEFFAEARKRELTISLPDLNEVNGAE